jgi:putative transposase
VSRYEFIRVEKAFYPVTVLCLAGDGVRVSRKKVASLMRKYSLIGRTKRRFRCSTDRRETESIAPNLLARNFTTTAPNQVC